MKSFKTSVLIVYLVAVSSFSLFAQSDLPSTVWDKIASSDLKMTAWNQDTSASAAVLSNIGDLTMMDYRNSVGFRLNVHKRIKIFKRDAFEYANQELRYWAKDDYEYIEFIRAQTITPTGQRIPVDKKSVLTQKLNDKISALKFTFPNVTEGCVIELEYEIMSQNVWELREWYFQEGIPTRESMLKLDIESRFEYTFLFKGESSLKSTKPVYTTNSDGKTTTGIGRTQIKFYIKDIPAMRSEPFVSTLDNYLTRIRFQLTKHFTEQGGSVEHSKTWEKATQELIDSDYFGKKYTKKSSYDKVWEKVAPLISESDSATLKAQKIYDWVNTHCKWNERWGIYATQTGDELLEKVNGNTAELNLLLVALLKSAGLEANPLILSTRDHEQLYKNTPILDQFNDVIVHLDKGNNSFILLDAGNALRPMGMIREDANNGEGWLVKKKGGAWVDIKPSMSDKVTLITAQIDENGQLKGNLAVQYKGYKALEERTELMAHSKAPDVQLKENISKKMDWKIESVTVENQEKVDMPLKETVDFVHENAADKNDNILYFKPNLYSEWENNPFKSSNRLFPIEFIYPFSERLNFSLTIPNGFKVDELPKSVNSSFQNGEVLFTYSVTNIENKVSIAAKIVLKSIYFDTQAYPNLKSFFDQISSKLQEQIVLKRENK